MHPGSTPPATSLNERLIKEVEAAADCCRRTAAVGDLVRLRDARLHSGRRISGDWDTSLGRASAEPRTEAAWMRGSLPECDRRDLSLGVLSAAMRQRGALIVRNLMGPREARDFRLSIDAVIAAANAHAKETADGGPDMRTTDMKAAYLPLTPAAGLPERQHKAFLGQSGAIETFLSPRVSFELFELFERLGLRSLLQHYFRDEPCVSFNKSVLRRTEPLSHPAEWHQDGAFMTEGIQSLNLWIALSECGGATDCPGMDILPRRLDRVLPTGTNGAIFKWSVSGATVSESFPDVAPQRPTFAAGDAILFDHLNLHATSSDPSYTEARYAIETWFFSKSRCAINQYPAFW